jgi:hypothetical protein
MHKLLIITLTLLGSTTLYAADPSHCSKDENVVFSCSVGKKTASVCASRDAAKDKGYVQYRFGMISKPEMTFPDNKEPGNKNFTFEYFLGASGYSNLISFNKGTYSYEVISSFTKGQDIGSIEVWRSGKIITTIQCKNPPESIESDGLRKIGMNEVKE